MDPAVLDEIRAFQAARTRRVKSEDGWLSLVERHVLLPGSNSLDGLGTATFAPDGTVELVLADGTRHTWGPAADGGPYLFVGKRRYELLRQRDKVAIRVRDPDAPTRLAALDKPLLFFEPSERFRVTATLVGPERAIETVTGLGAHIQEKVPGTLHFTIDGRALTLDPVIEADAPHRLFINFKDLTNGAETYGAGRFIYTKGLPDADGRILLDFNTAFTPPCALTEFASCPITPPQNRLPIRVEAGEMTFAP